MNIDDKLKRKQSDEKWRAGVVNCYSILKKIIPFRQDKRISKGLTLDKSHEYLLKLEKTLESLLMFREKQKDSILAEKLFRYLNDFRCLGDIKDDYNKMNMMTNLKKKITKKHTASLQQSTGMRPTEISRIDYDSNPPSIVMPVDYEKKSSEKAAAAASKSRHLDALSISDTACITKHGIAFDGGDGGEARAIVDVNGHPILHGYAYEDGVKISTYYVNDRRVVYFGDDNDLKENHISGKVNIEHEACSTNQMMDTRCQTSTSQLVLPNISNILPGVKSIENEISYFEY